MTGLTFGSFDPVHAGHIRLFRACREHCDFLVVVVHSEEHIRRNKPGREPLPLADRIRDVSDVRTVDVVYAGDQRSKAAWVAAVKPDVVFVGPETTETPWAARTVVLPRMPGVSSSGLRGAGVVP